MVMDAAGSSRSCCCRASMAVSLFIKRIASMAFHPLEFNLARNDFDVEFFPQIDVLLALPFKVHGFDDVLTVAPQDDSSAGRNHPQPLDHSRQLHAIVGRGRVAAINRPRDPTRLDDDRGPSAWSRIPEAGSICVNVVNFAPLRHSYLLISALPAAGRIRASVQTTPGIRGRRDPRKNSRESNCP